MKTRNMTALLTAALMALSTPMLVHADAGQSASAEHISSPRADVLPFGYEDAQQDMAALTGARGAHIAGDSFLYIDAHGRLISRSSGGEMSLAEGVRMITHADEAAVYVLMDASAAPSDMADHGSDSAPATGWELAQPMVWVRISLSDGSTGTVLDEVTSVPIVASGHAYALDARGDLMRSDMAGGSEVVCAAEGGVLRVRPAPGGVICARYEDGQMLSCRAIDGEGAQDVPRWTAFAEFHDGYALALLDGIDGRSGLYIFTPEGERLLDEHAGNDWLICKDTLYFWHADPEQAYGFRDLMACELPGGAPSPVEAGAELRARLIEYQGEIYLTNYDSELYRIAPGMDEPEYVMDLSVDYDFDSDIMPDVALYSDGEKLGALIYLDEGEGYRFIGEAAE